MNEKKIRILDSAMQLFASKGFHATSMQEIATDSGVSKGALYLHFRSKDELLVAVYQYYYDTITQRMNVFEEDLQLSPKDRFIEQLTVFFQSFIEQKEIIFMHIRESMTASEGMHNLVLKIRKQSYQWYEQKLLEIYGDRVREHTVDLSILFQGMIDSYLKVMLIDQSNLQLRELTSYLVERLDDLVDGVCQRKQPPMLTKETFKLSSLASISQAETKKLALNVLREIEERIIDLNVANSEKQDYLDAVAFLKEEVEKTSLKKVIFQGIAACLRIDKELDALVNRLVELVMILMKEEQGE